MAIYLKYGSVGGDVTESGHSGWIELNSVQWGVGRGVSSPTGSGGDREASAPSVSEVTITKAQDSASSGLLLETFNGTGAGNGASVQIDFCRTTAGQLNVYLSFVLSQVIISGFSLSSGGDRASESLSMNFNKVAVTFTPMNADGTPGNGSTVTYDLALAKTV
jgi:type VI secretion system secreted protein Hcp